MENTLRFTKMTRSLVERGIFASHPFTLLDVGCSGGISPFWRVFEPSLIARGIDPVVTECERLNRKELNPNVRYLRVLLAYPRIIRLYKDGGAENLGVVILGID